MLDVLVISSLWLTVVAGVADFGWYCGWYGWCSMAC